MIKLNGYVVEPTIFPDKTSQVWKLSEEYMSDHNDILWEFESEAELFHICQLANLLKSEGLTYGLRMPYLPYARQDKEISNESSFALHTFADMINFCHFEYVKFIDGHSPVAKQLIHRSVDVFPDDNVNRAVNETKASMVCYPDAGAKDRYVELSHDLPVCSFTKDRDQKTGYIKNLWLNELIGLQGHTVLIVDDLCDGGMTFKLTAERLLEIGAKEVHLYVTHGIFSKGLETLRESGIKRIFTYKGES